MIKELTAAIINSEAENKRREITEQADDYLKHISEDIKINGNVLTVNGISCGHCFLTLKAELITEG